MWTRAVWLEKDREEEGVVPASWIKEMMLYWPPGVNASKAMTEKREPGEKWRTFKVVKVKITSENRDECEAFDETTAAEESDADNAETQKRQKKKKLFQDFITEEQQDEQNEVGNAMEVDICTREKDKQGRKEESSLPVPPKKLSAKQMKSPSFQKETLECLGSKTNKQRSRSKTRSQSSGSASCSQRSRSRSRSQHSSLSSHTSRPKVRSQLSRSNSCRSRSRSWSESSRSSSLRSRLKARSKKSRSRSRRSRSKIRSYRSKSSSLRSGSDTMDNRSGSKSDRSRSGSTCTSHRSVSKRRLKRSRCGSNSRRSRSKTLSHMSQSPSYSQRSGSKSRRSRRSRSGSRSQRSRIISCSRSEKSRSRSKSQRSRSEFQSRKSRSSKQSTASEFQRSRSRIRSQSRSYVSSKSSKSQATTSTEGNCQTPCMKEKETYPMSEAKFQRRIMFLLTEIRHELKLMKDGMVSPILEEESSESLKKATSIEEMNCLEEDLKKAEVRRKLIQRLSSVGGLSMRDNMKKVMERVMSNDLMARYNMRGNKGKLAFSATNLCSVVKASVLNTFKTTTEHDLDVTMGSVLKYAPDRRGGGGRKSTQLDDN